MAVAPPLDEEVAPPLDEAAAPSPHEAVAHALPTWQHQAVLAV